ncbi:hypothetical protein D1AOALGA4SA_12845 [Olavius algarvensis Delta 1 endosymbiont]|nr:hypothetical protein D1AOALGA4SA_12845 [Olavius algarvensis Delta 1 endosymbiont]
MPSFFFSAVATSYISTCNMLIWRCWLCLFVDYLRPIGKRRCNSAKPLL